MTATPSFLRPRTWLLAAAAGAALGSIALLPASAQTTGGDTILEADIATEPLYSQVEGDRPTMLLAPSVEFPTVGVQYREETYDPADEYIGYYNHEMCYRYNKTEQYFEITRKGTIRSGEKGARCGGGDDHDDEFSGNFLNWATSSAMDIVRLALTGGDRVIDTATTTVLQRAYIPEGTAQVTSVTLMGENGTAEEKTETRGPGCYFKHSSYFPTKVLRKSDGGGNYAGAIPSEMIEALDEQDASRPDDDSDTPAKERLFIASIGNRIHFGVHPMGGINQHCDYGPYNYQVGAGGAVNDFHYARRNAFWPTSAHDSCDFDTDCEADEDGQRVWFGDSVAGHQWITGIVKGSFKCGGDIFNNANRHDDTGETKTPFDSTSKCYLEDEDALLSGDDFFYARVKVCDAKDVRDYHMCVEYPNGKKKPTGVIQKYADNLRVGAFGYAIDQTAAHDTDDYKGRFGALLRAPMKYVGPNTYTHTGVKKDGTNSKKEWDTETGVLVENPEGRPEGVSGVINYFNRFGRNPDKKGNYKQYDNVAEMYYEALRYMQGLGPSEAAIWGLDDTMKDGFPAYIDWAGLDPYDSTLGYTKDGDYTCLKSSILVIGDLYTHDPVNGGDKDKLRHTMAGKVASQNELDIKHWRDVVHAFETGESASYKDGQNTSQSTDTPDAEKTFPANMTHVSEKTRNVWSFIPGMAYWAHTHDIRGTGWTAQPTKQRPGLRLTSYFIDVNENGWSTRYNYRAGRANHTGGTERPATGTYHWGSQYWLGAKYGGFLTPPTTKVNECPADGVIYSGTGNPFYQSTCAVVNGKATYTKGTQSNAVWSDLSKTQGDNTDGRTNPEPRTFYMPDNARGVLKAFDDIFGDQQPPSNRSIAGADSSGGIGGTSFQAEFGGADWSGDVIAESIVVGGGTEKRRANNNLPSHEARKIFMGTSTHSIPRAFEFKADSVPRDVSSALGGDINGVNASAADRINWLRGDQSKEGKPFRARTRLLGDIVNSGVKYVGAPAGQVNLGLGYDAFVDAQTYRRAAVYVGANDGMLHAFHAGGKQRNATTDEVTEVEPTLAELFAYIPSWMKGKLAALTDPAYRHQLYVDATPVIGDANLKGDCTVTNSPNTGDTDCDWRSVLVSGTGGGGRGVFALDVTNPEAFDASKVLWEFTDADDPDMGYVLGQARIVKLLFTEADATTTLPTPAVYRWFAMVPAGVNSYAGDDTARRGNGDANIFLLALDKAAGTAWTQGTNYWKLRLPRIQALQATHPTGILNLEAFTGVGGVTEYVYAGDLHGQLWAFKFKGIDSTGWNTATLANCYSSGSCQEGAVKPLFIATTSADGDGNTEPQPITVAPTILEGAGNGVHFVSFGTGKYFEKDDAQTTKIDTFYTVYSNFNHRAEQVLSRNNGDAIIPDRSYLQEVVKDRTEDGVNYFKPSQAFFWGWLASAPTAGDTPNTRSGWFMDFVERGENDATTAVGERQIADASWVNLTSRLMFSTLTPNSATNTDVCGTGGGDSKLYTFDMISGIGTGRHSAVGMLAQPLVFLDTANTRETQADSTGRRLRISPVMSGQFGSGGSDVSQVDTVIVPFGRLSWRRIDNFEGLRQSGGTSNPSAGGNNAGGGDSGNSNSGD